MPNCSKICLQFINLVPTFHFVKQLFRIQIQKGGKVLIWNQVKSRMEACYYSELMWGSKKYINYWILNWIKWIFDLPATVNSEHPAAIFWNCCRSREINVNLKNILPHNVITATHKHKLGLAPWTNQAEFHSPPDVSIFTPKNMIKPH